MSPFSSSQITPPAIQGELDAGERVLWSGQPAPNHLARRALGGSLFGLLMLAFSLFWMWGASESLRRQLGTGQAPDLINLAFPAFGLLFVGFAAPMVISPLLERRKAPHTFYALTDRRALIVVENSKVQSVMPLEFSLERQDKPNGRGDLILKRETKGSGDNQRTSEIGFFGIENAREVERLARQITA